MSHPEAGDHWAGNDADRAVLDALEALSRDRWHSVPVVAALARVTTQDASASLRRLEKAGRAQSYWSRSRRHRYYGAVPDGSDRSSNQTLNPGGGDRRGGA